MTRRHAQTIRDGIRVARWIGDDVSRFLVIYATLFTSTKLEVRAMARSLSPYIVDYINQHMIRPNKRWMA